MPRSMFSQRHYRAIAAVLRANRPIASFAGFSKLTSTDKTVQWDNTVRALADTFSLDSDKFKRSLFYDACGGLYDV